MIWSTGGQKKCISSASPAHPPTLPRPTSTTHLYPPTHPPQSTPPHPRRLFLLESTAPAWQERGELSSPSLDSDGLDDDFDDDYDKEEEVNESDFEMDRRRMTSRVGPMSPDRGRYVEAVMGVALWYP